MTTPPRCKPALPAAIPCRVAAAVLTPSAAVNHVDPGQPSDDLIEGDRLGFLMQAL